MFQFSKVDEEEGLCSTGVGKIHYTEGTRELGDMEEVGITNNLELLVIQPKMVESTLGMVGLLVHLLYQLVYSRGFQNHSN